MVISAAATATTETKYLIVIASEAKYRSRRDLIRSTYFDIEDSLIPPSTTQNVQYVFCVYDALPAENTLEKRAFETERMELNDIMLLGESIEYHLKNVIDWLKCSCFCCLIQELIRQIK